MTYEITFLYISHLHEHFSLFIIVKLFCLKMQYVGIFTNKGSESHLMNEHCYVYSVYTPTAG